MASGAGFVEAYAVLYAELEDSSAWTLGGAIRFSSVANTEQFVSNVRESAADLLALGAGPLLADELGGELLGLSLPGGAAGVLLEAATDDDGILGTCMTIEKLEQDDDVVVFWVDLSGCRAGDSVVDAELTCPAVLEAGSTGSATITTPVYTPPVTWQADPDTIEWTIDGPVKATVVSAGKVVLGSLEATDAQAPEQQAKVGIKYRRITRINWLGIEHILKAGYVAGYCTLTVVDEAAPVDVAGSWKLDITTAPVNDYCDESEIYSERVFFEQSESTVKVTGIDGQIDTWGGTITGNQLTFGGEKEDGAGRTMATFVMTVDGDTMSGQELWSYEDSGGSCPDGTSVVLGARD